MIAEVTISEIILRQRKFFNTGKTKDINFRIAQLKSLYSSVAKNEAANRPSDES